MFKFGKTAPNGAALETTPADIMPEQPWQPGMGQRLAGAILGQTRYDLMDAHDATDARRTQANDVSQILGGLSDRERLAFYANPGAFGSSTAENLKPQHMAGGSTVRPGMGFGGTYTAPSLTSDGGVYGTQTPGGWQKTGERPIGAAEQAKLDAQEGQTASLDAYRNQQIKLGQARAAIAARKTGAKPGSGGFVLPQGYRPVQR